jgi:hypothetical protein
MHRKVVMKRTRLTGTLAGLVLAMLLSVAWETGEAPAKHGKKRTVARVSEEPVPVSGPVVALYVVDHNGASPDAVGLAPYREAFHKVLAGCWVGPSMLSSVVFYMSDRATLGSGVEFKNLAVLQAMARHVGPRRQNCNDDFFVIESRLIGSALDG